MYKLDPITQRVAEIRERYRSTNPKACGERYRLITEFYTSHPELTGILRRAYAFRYLCENMPTYIDEGEVIVGSLGASFRACAFWPEVQFSNPALYEEMKYRTFRNREKDQYDIDDETMEYIAQTGEYWLTEAVGTKFDQYVPPKYAHDLDSNGVITFKAEHNSQYPVGHFIGNFRRPLEVGFEAMRQEAVDKMAALEGHAFGSSMDQYNFYRAISIVCEGMILYTERYALECERKAKSCEDEARSAEYMEMADVLHWISKNPARTFHEAVQMTFLYDFYMALEMCMHGMSFGRMDQYLGSYYEADIDAGRITHERAQELVDLLFLKIAQMVKVEATSPFAGLGYTTGQLITIGGTDRELNDATNPVTFMILQAAGRLVLHDPPIALRIHKGTPDALWEAAIETTKISGGVPTFEYDDTIIPSLTIHGMAEEDARDYGLVGCVEPGGNGNEWTCAGGNGCDNFFNLPAVVLLAMNNGVNPMPRFDGQPPRQAGLPTGYLYEMESFDQVLDATWKQMKYFVDWQMTMTNAFEYVAREEMPFPVASAAMEGCMESGTDVMRGGAKYNSCGVAGIGIGNIVDSLSIIRHMCFDNHICTTRELYDAVMNDWGTPEQEELRQYILHECPHYGNDDPYVDDLARQMSDHFQKYCLDAYGYRCKMRPGLWPVTMNVLFGFLTYATFDGRKAGSPLADGISPIQSLDKNGPTAILKSVSHIDQTKLGNGTLLNMRFHPTALSANGGLEKLKMLMQTYFEMGGMQMQINVTSTKTLREAQKKPEEYRDLVVRVAGFSVYFVELYEGSQEDIITRTELAM